MQVMVAVKQSHHAFDNTDVRVFPLTGIDALHFFRRCHEQIQVVGFPSGCRRMVFGVEVIRTTFEGLHPETPVAQGTQQAQGERSFAAA